MSRDERGGGATYRRVHLWEAQRADRDQTVWRALDGDAPSHAHLLIVSATGVGTLLGLRVCPYVLGRIWMRCCRTTHNDESRAARCMGTFHEVRHPTAGCGRGRAAGTRGLVAVCAWGANQRVSAITSLYYLSVDTSNSIGKPKNHK